jgi:hypothetical protein
MNPVLDLTGASGAVYRFRLVGDLNDLPVMAGNFVCVRGDGGGEIVCCGTARSLVQARGVWAAAVKEHKADQLYVRLNVSRSLREAEHEDIVQAARPPLVLTDIG